MIIVIHCLDPIKSSILKKILIKIYYAHFMNILSRAIDKKFKSLKPEKKFILEIFSLLCMCRDISSFDKLFTHLCIVLLAKKHEIKNDSIKTLSNMISETFKKKNLTKYLVYLWKKIMNKPFLKKESKNQFMQILLFSNDKTKLWL